MRRVSFDFASALGARAFFILTGFSTSALTARFLGPVGRGEYFLCLTLVALATQFGNFGLASATCYWAAKSPDNRPQLAINALWISVLIGLPLGGVIAVSGHAGLGLVNVSQFSLGIASLMVPFGLYSLLVGNLLIGSGRIHEYNLIDVATRTFGVMALIAIGWWSASAGNFLMVALVVAALSGGMTWRVTQCSISNFRPDISLLCKGMGYAGRAWGAALLSFAVSRINTLFVGEQLGHDALGVWSIAVQIGDILAIIPAVIGQILLPRLVMERDPWKAMREYLPRVALMMGVLCLLIAFVGQSVIDLVFGLAFTSAYVQLLWLLPGIFCLSLSSVISQYLGAVGIPRFVIVVWGAALGVETLLSYYLVPQFSSVGAMAALSASYIFVLCALWFLARRHAVSNS
jgi:O-antigen/teichoic acid export membrane protein